MARMHALQALNQGKVALILMIIIVVMFLADYQSRQAQVFATTTLTGQSEELSHLSTIKREKSLSYIKNPYGQAEED